MSEFTLHCLLYLAITAVLLGVVLEGYEHLHDFRQSGWRPLWPKVGFAILVLGLCGELALEPLFQTAETDFRIDAARRIADAGRAAAEAEARAAQANERAEAAQLEQEKLKASNLALRDAVKPRRMGFVPKDKYEEFKTVLAEIHKAAGTLLLIQVVPDDFEATVLANDIAYALSHSDWRIRYVSEAETGVSPIFIGFGAGLSGISVVTWQQIESPIGGHADEMPKARAWAAGEALSKYLTIVGLDTNHWGVDPPRLVGNNDVFTPEEFRPPLDAVVLFVGPKDVWLPPLPD